MAEPKVNKPLPVSAVSVYAVLLGSIREKAKELGYAIGLHGSMHRDMDLIAVPWVEEAVPGEELAAAIATICDGYVARKDGDGNGGGRVMPLGRVAYTIVIWGLFIDLSVTPRVAPAR